MAKSTRWKHVKLGEIAEFRNGVNYNKESFGSGVKVVGVKDFQDYSKPKYDTLEQINPEGVVTSKSILHDGDIIFVRSNGNRELIGRSLFIDHPTEEVTHSAFTIRVRFTSPEIYPKFYSYFFRTSAIRKGLTAYGGGTNISNLNQDILSGLEIPIPDLPTQRKIAGILSAYDDLIENNLRRIKILEEMAQSLYREWFVHFRFPGHESAKFVDSELGLIPKGWEVKSMTEAVTVRPKVSIPKGDNIPFVTMGGLSENSMLITEIETRDEPTGARFQNRDTLFARITPCLENGKTGYVEFLPSDEAAACGSTEFIVLRSKTVCPQYVYLMARSDAFRDNAIKSMSGATGRQRVRDECFDQFFLAQPPGDLLARFESITLPKFELIHSLNRRNQNLRRTRDLLLPKLLNPN